VSRHPQNKIRGRANKERASDALGITPESYSGTFDLMHSFSVIAEALKKTFSNKSYYNFENKFNNLNQQNFQAFELLTCSNPAYFQQHFSNFFFAASHLKNVELHPPLRPINIAHELKKELVIALLLKHKDLLAGIWLSKEGNKKLDYILALNENTAENRAELDSVIYNLEEIGILKENEVEFHYISSAQESNINQDKVNRIPIAA